jgi:hypothetical protein
LDIQVEAVVPLINCNISACHDFDPMHLAPIFLPNKGKIRSVRQAENICSLR